MRPFFLLFGLFALAWPTSAQDFDHGGLGGQKRNTELEGDPREVVAELIEADEVSEDRFNHLASLVNEERKKLEFPSIFEDPEALYSDEQHAFRNDYYGPLFDDPETRKFLQDLVAEPREEGSYSMAPFTAAILLGDHPSLRHLEILYQRYLEPGGAHWMENTITRQLGRLLIALNSSSDEATRAKVEEVLGELESIAKGSDRRRAGKAIETLYRAGCQGLALERLKRFLQAPTITARELEVFEGCTRLFNSEEMDAELRIKATTMAQQVASDALERASSSRAMLAFSPEARDFRSAMGFLRRIQADEVIDFLVKCYNDPFATSLLGMDAFQSLRFALQRTRAKLSEERQGELDENFVREIRNAAETLFMLEDGPMDEEAYSSFHRDRDRRYNAASYLSTLWDRHEDLRERLLSDPDFSEFLTLIANARENETEASNAGVLYFQVAEKLETRMVCCSLMAKMQRDEDTFETEIDLFEEFAMTLVKETGAPIELVEEARRLYERPSPWLTLEFDIVTMPDDRYLMNLAIESLGHLGMTCERKEKRITLRNPE